MSDLFGCFAVPCCFMLFCFCVWSLNSCETPVSAPFCYGNSCLWMQEPGLCQHPWDVPNSYLVPINLCNYTGVPKDWSVRKHWLVKIYCFHIPNRESTPCDAVRLWTTLMCSIGHICPLAAQSNDILLWMEENQPKKESIQKGNKWPEYTDKASMDWTAEKCRVTIGMCPGATVSESPCSFPFYFCSMLPAGEITLIQNDWSFVCLCWLTGETLSLEALVLHFQCHHLRNIQEVLKMSKVLNTDLYAKSALCYFLLSYTKINLENTIKVPWKQCCSTWD